MPDLNMRAADPCPTNNAKRAKHSKILKPGCFFVFTPFYQWTNSVLCGSLNETLLDSGKISSFLLGFESSPLNRDRDVRLTAVRGLTGPGI